MPDAAETEATGWRATHAQVFEDAEHLIAAWNKRQAKHMPMLFSLNPAPESDHGELDRKIAFPSKFSRSSVRIWQRSH